MATQSEIPKNGYTIGELAELVGLSPRTIDFYTREGLLHPYQPHPGHGYRHYTEEDRQRIHLIRQLQKRKFSLQEIRSVLDSSDRKKTPPVVEVLERINMDLEKLRGLVQETKSSPSSTAWENPALMRLMVTEALQKATGLCSLLVTLLKDQPLA